MFGEPTSKISSSLVISSEYSDIDLIVTIESPIII